MRLLELAAQLDGQRRFQPDWQVVEGIRARLPAGDVCTCGVLSCPTPGEHSRYSVWVERPRSGLYSLAERAAAHKHSNLACVCGQRDGLLVLDIEDVDAEAALSNRFGDLPPTVATVSPEGVTAKWFLCREGGYAPADALGAGVTVRAAGTWALLPGSRTPSGVYAWAAGASPADLPFAVLPRRWFAEIMGPEPRAQVFGARRPISPAA